MNKLLLGILSVILIFSSCKEDFKGYELNGQIKGLENQEIILQFLKQNEVIEIDTVMTDSIGKFTMKGFVEEKGYHRISSGQKGWIFLLENNVKPTIEIDANSEGLENIKISNYLAGQTLQETINFLNEKNKPIYELQYKQQFIFQDTSISMEEKVAAQQQFLDLKEKTDKEIKEKIDADLTVNPFSALYLLPVIDDIEYVKKVVPKLDSVIPNSIYVTNIKDALAQVEQQKLEQTKQVQPQTQQTQTQSTDANAEFAKKIEMNDTEGNLLKLSDLKGKIVLVDFWASWCRPCRAANPGVVKIYHKYKDQGFDVFSVSLDKGKDKWVNAIKQDGLVWSNHVSDLKGWSNAAAQAWGVRSIPATYLLDRDGKIIGKNLKGAQLEAKLKEVL